jgi:hypothetical protein
VIDGRAGTPPSPAGRSIKDKANPELLKPATRPWLGSELAELLRLQTWPRERAQFKPVGRPSRLLWMIKIIRKTTFSVKWAT